MPSWGWRPRPLLSAHSLSFPACSIPTCRCHRWHAVRDCHRGDGLPPAIHFPLFSESLFPISCAGAIDGTLYEIAIVVMGSYLAYLVAEVVGMSGIVALFFSGGSGPRCSEYSVCWGHSCQNIPLCEGVPFVLGRKVVGMSGILTLFFSGEAVAGHCRAGQGSCACTTPITPSRPGPSPCCANSSTILNL